MQEKQLPESDQWDRDRCSAAARQMPCGVAEESGKHSQDSGAEELAYAAHRSGAYDLRFPGAGESLLVGVLHEEEGLEEVHLVAWHTSAGLGMGRPVEDRDAVGAAVPAAVEGDTEHVAEAVADHMRRTAVEVEPLDCARPCAPGQKPASGQIPG